MPTYTVFHQRTTAVTGTTGTAANRDVAINNVIAAAAGPTVKEVSIYSCELVGMTGPTGIYGTTYNTIGPVTGSTFGATGPDAAAMQAVAAGPVGPGAGIDIWSIS